MSAILPHKIKNSKISKEKSHPKDCAILWLCDYVAVTKMEMWEQCHRCGYIYHKSTFKANKSQPINSFLKVKPEPILPILSKYVSQNHKPIEKKKIVFSGVVLLFLSFIVAIFVM